jgi:phosphoesterase RecJ-like protein
MDEIRRIIQSNGSFVITAHINPDGDAVGASLGLALALRAAGKDARVILDGFPKKFSHLPGMELINSQFTIHNSQLGDMPVLICLDCANKERLFVADHFDKYDVTVNIDHHISNTGYAKHNYIEAAEASACELVYKLIDGFLPMTGDVADLLLLGLLADTGGLSHGAINDETLHNTAMLIKSGADITKIKKRILNFHTMPEAKLMGTALVNLRLVCDDQVTVSHLTTADFEAAHAAYSDTDGIAEYMLEVEGAEVSLLFTERDNGFIKINFRSMNVNVSDIAAAYGGGGHINAAGANVEGNIHYVMEVVIAKVWDALRNY